MRAKRRCCVVFPACILSQADRSSSAASRSFAARSSWAAFVGALALASGQADAWPAARFEAAVDRAAEALRAGGTRVLATPTVNHGPETEFTRSLLAP